MDTRVSWVSNSRMKSNLLILKYDIKLEKEDWVIRIFYIAATDYSLLPFLSSLRILYCKQNKYKCISRSVALLQLNLL